MKSVRLIALMLITLSLLVVPLAWSQGENDEQQVRTRPDYCPLPDKLEFDYATPERGSIGIWTGQWKDTAAPRFCVVITSIQRYKARGFFSQENKGEGHKGEYKGGFVAFKSTTNYSKSTETITLKTPDKRRIILHLRFDETVWADTPATRWQFRWPVHLAGNRQASEVQLTKVK